jgi:hypothetical protein
MKQSWKYTGKHVYINELLVIKQSLGDRNILYLWKMTENSVVFWMEH